MPKQNILFIINPISGTGKVLDWAVLIEENLDPSKYSFHLYYTKARGDATKASAGAAKKGFHMVCAIGGDGTINEVAQGLIGTNSALAIIPRGSGNGLARHLGIPTKPIDALLRLNHAKQTTMDVGTLEGQIFLCAAGMGFDAAVAKAFDQYGKRGLLSYVWLAYKAYIKYKPSVYHIIIDRKKIKVKAFLIAFANASQFGNDAYIAPEAKTNDGLLNLVVIKPFPIWRALGIVLKTFNGTIHQSKYCKTFVFDKLTIKSSDSLAHTDGEPLVLRKETHVSVLPNSLKIVY